MPASSLEALPLNLEAFSHITAGADANASAVLVATYIGEFVPFLVLALFGISWLARGASRRPIFIAVAAAALGIAFNLAIAGAFPQPRPFEMGLGQNLLHHAPEASFPSDHVTLIWSLALGFLAGDGSLFWGLAVVALGAAVAWARIFLGVHFPLDMVGSLAVAMTSGVIARFAGGRLYRSIYLPVAEQLALRFGRWF